MATAPAGSAELVERLLAGDRHALARAISHVEADTETGREVLERVYSRTGGAQTVGVTGSAGTGKSTLVGALTREERSRGRTVGIVAVDPSSPFSHGAILGDRIRMQDLTGDSGVFLRSMASRGNLGGLSETATGVVDLMDAAGFDVIFLETVGAGQDEVEVATATGTTVLVATPAGGDDIQSMKAGLMEVAQILVVNKADIAGADTAAAQLLGLLAIADLGSWAPPVLKTVAKTGEGVPELVDAIDDHQAHIRSDEFGEAERRDLVRDQIISLSRATLHREAREAAERSGALAALVEQVAERRRDPRSAAHELLEAVRESWIARR